MILYVYTLTEPRSPMSQARWHMLFTSTWSAEKVNGDHTDDPTEELVWWDVAR